MAGASDSIFAIGDCTATSYAPTAQVASQQGKYLGKKLSRLAQRRAVFEANGLALADAEEAAAGPFRYLHLGSLAYIGNAAVFDMGRFNFTGGPAEDPGNSLLCLSPLDPPNRPRISKLGAQNSLKYDKARHVGDHVP